MYALVISLIITWGGHDSFKYHSRTQPIDRAACVARAAEFKHLAAEQSRRSSYARESFSAACIKVR